MPDLGVAHLPVGQADREPRGLDQRVRAIPVERIEVRRLRETDRVRVALAALAIAIEDHEDRAFVGGAHQPPHGRWYGSPRRIAEGTVELLHEKDHAYEPVQQRQAP